MPTSAALLFTGSIPWQGIAHLYAQINRKFPTLGSQVAGAVATAEAGDAKAGLEQLDAMASARTRGFQPWWVARAHLLGRADEAASACETAIGLCTQQRLRDFLEAKRRALKPG